MIKKQVLTIVLFFTVGICFAQRMVYVDTEYILDQLPAFTEAQEALEEQTAEWKDEIAEREQEVISMRADFEQKEPLMPENLKLKERDKITSAEQALRDLKNKRFGPKGDLFQKQQSLIQPIQDNIYNAVKKMADQRGYDFVLDKSTGVSILYVKPEFDMSDEVLRIVKQQ